jgi:hypothetical protein
MPGDSGFDFEEDREGVFWVEVFFVAAEAGARSSAREKRNAANRLMKWFERSVAAETIGASYRTGRPLPGGSEFQTKDEVPTSVAPRVLHLAGEYARRSPRAVKKREFMIP